MNSNEITKKTSFEILNEGDKILNTHEFYNELSDLMENEQFSNFFKKYFTDMTETKITVVYMKLYQEFKNKWREMNDDELDKRINIFLLWNMMHNQTVNKFTLHTVLNHLDNPKNINIFDNLKKFIEILCFMIIHDSMIILSDVLSDAAQCIQQVNLLVDPERC